MAQDAHRTIDAVWRIESPKLIASLARTVRDLDLAEEFAQDAFVAALSQWPDEGVPRNPGAWLMTIAKRRAIDHIRREIVLGRKTEELERDVAAWASPGADATVDEIDDDLLRLIFVTCHPVLPKESRVALALRLLGGMATPEIARAFLVSEPTVAQRKIGRASCRERV